MSRDFKNALFAQFARIGHALASPKRIELLDLLSQNEKTVDMLAKQSGTAVKNTSAHLRVLRQAHLVETRRAATHVHYRLADDGVFRLLQSVQALGHNLLAEVERVTDLYINSRDNLEPITSRELRKLMRRGDVTVIDVRPREEYEAGHIPGALSFPVSGLKRRLREILGSREVVAYCRGPYCVYSIQAVEILRKHGFRARRAREGLPHWRAEGLPVAKGA